MNRLEELTLKLVDGEIAEDEARELDELTRSTAGHNLFVRLLEVESYLLSAGPSPCADRVVDALRLQRCQRIEDGVMSAVGVGDLDDASVLGERAETTSATMPGYRALLSFVCVVFLTIAVGIAVWSRSDERLSPILAELVAPESSVVVSDAASNTIQTLTDVTQSIPLRAGQSVETSGSMEFAEIVYADGTRIELLGHTRVILSRAENDAKQLTVVAGMIQADVAPQPENRPLQIVTSTATLEVLGTTLGVEVDSDSTQLEVASGLVAITRNVDDQRVNVLAGQYVRATDSAGDAMLPYVLPDLPGEWQQDFASGLPAGWQAGHLVGEGDDRAVRATSDDAGSERSVAVTTQNAWREGDHALFQVHDDSLLNIRFQQNSSARIRLMVVTRVFPPQEGRVGGNFFYTRKAWNQDLPPGQWKTISVPLSEIDWYVRRRKRQTDKPGLEGLAAYMIQISTDDADIGLTVDRIWVTRGLSHE